MNVPIEYIVMGEDGKEYGPVNSKQIRLWVAEGRLEKKTPVKPSDARDWIFLGEVPEFVRLFPKPRRVRAPMVPPRKGLVKALVIVALVTAVYYLFRHYHPH